MPQVDLLYQLGLVVPSVLAIVFFLLVAILRIRFPFALEWLEAASYVHVLRVLEGKPIYVAPSYEFIPSIYTPLYYYMAAPLAQFTQNVMLSMRLLSVACTLVAFVALYGISRARHLPHVLSLLAVGFLAACYKVTAYWFDLGRVDMMFLALVLVSIWLVVIHDQHGILSGITAGVVISMAFATKQQALVAYPFLFLYLLVERRRRKALAFGLSAALLLIALILSLNAASRGWFWFYVFTVPSSEPIAFAGVMDFWRIHLAPDCWPLIAIVILGLLVAVASGHRLQLAPRSLSLALIVLPLLIMSYLSLAKQWGYLNGFLPAAAGLALTGAEVLHYTMNSLHRGSWMRATVLGLLLALVLLHFGVSRYDPLDQISSTANLRAGNEVLQRMSRAQMPIFAPTAPYLLDMIGQPMHYQTAALSDVDLAAQNNTEGRGYRVQVSAGHVAPPGSAHTYCHLARYRLVRSDV